MQKLPWCPYCGQDKRFGCQCEYGRLMKMKMEPDPKQKGFFHKKFCPHCQKAGSQDHCSGCGLTFSDSDFWIARLW